VGVTTAADQALRARIADTNANSRRVQPEEVA
jgi:hypothetical protein